jgi:Xaa-Pro aminopeptidase
MSNEAAARWPPSSAGDTEYAVGRRIIEALYASGISEHRTLIVASGERSWFPNVGPSQRVLRPGDVVRVEVFAGEGGYQAGVARTAVVGTPGPELVRQWAQVSGARSAALDLLRPGADPVAIYRAYVDALGPLGERAIVFFGHGMGLDLHEPPYLTATSTDPLEAGAILGVEPFVMIPGLFGLQVKDVVALTAGGYDLLSDRLDGGALAVIDG